MGAVSTPGLPLPQNRFRHPEDAREQLQRGLNLHQEVFGIRPQGVWPSEGSVSEEVLGIAQSLGVKWMATDEEVLGRSLGVSFGRDGHGHLPGDLAEKLYTIHRFENEQTEMNLIFRDHTISDLIGFVYSGMAPQDAANHLMHNIKQSAQPVLDAGHDAVVPIILDGENAWEYYPQSGREFLRRFYDALQREPWSGGDHGVRGHCSGTSIFPGSSRWFRAPGFTPTSMSGSAPRKTTAPGTISTTPATSTPRPLPRPSEAQRKLAFEEILIAEGSDWNWWYGPEHHSANDREFDELYRKHLSNIYQLLGSRPPDYLAQPILGGGERPAVVPQTAYIHPRITGDMVRYFEWMGAAVYTADRRAGAMHGKQFLLDAVHAGIDETYIYGRLDFVENKVPAADFELVVNLESWADEGQRPRRALRLDVASGSRQDPELEGQRSRRRTARSRPLTSPRIRSPSLCSETLNSSFLWSGCWPLP